MASTRFFTGIRAALGAAPDPRSVLLVGRAAALDSDWFRAAVAGSGAEGDLGEWLGGRWASLVQPAGTPGDDPVSLATALPNAAGDAATQVAVGVVPTAGTRYNTASRADAVTTLVQRHGRTAPTQSGNVVVVLAVDSADQALSAALAVPRAFPLFSTKAAVRRAAAADPAEPARTCAIVVYIKPQGDGAAVALSDATVAHLQHLADGLRLAARLVDAPTSVCDTNYMVNEARVFAEQSPSVSIDVIQGDDLTLKGLNAIYGVGRAAEFPPALVVLTHKGAAPDDKCVAMVGKGIVYDTGGLSIKSKDGMVGMKADMGGSAAALGAFQALVRAEYPHTLHCLLCLADNAVGPLAHRPDDIIEMYSGLTVELNNTDAEGRLVLGDGVAYAAKHLAPSLVIDIATLTGAQRIATGLKHASIVTNDEGIEGDAVQAGKRTGDLAHPLPFAPEFFQAEFRSEVACMRNSVRNRSNAQPSCAAQFVWANLSATGYDGPWLHVDMAGPVQFTNTRGTGYGVALLAELLAPHTIG